MSGIRENVDEFRQLFKRSMLWNRMRENNLLFRPKKPKNSNTLYGNKILQELLIPDSIIEHTGTLEYSNKSHQILCASGWPAQIKQNWLYGISDAKNLNLEFAQIIEPVDIDVARSINQKFLDDCRVDEALIQDKGGRISEPLKYKIESTVKRLKDLNSGNENSFKMSLYFKTSAEDELTLSQRVGILISKIKSTMIIPSQLMFKQMPSHKALMPICSDPLEQFRHMDTTTLVCSLLVPPRAYVDSYTGDGTIIAINKDTGIPFEYDRFDIGKGIRNANVAVVAASGGGKTVMTALDITREVWKGRSVSIIDPKNDYVDLIEELGGEVIKIYEGGDMCLNPFDLVVGPKMSLQSKLQDLPSFFRMMLGSTSVTEAVEPILDDCLIKTYNSKSINNDSDTWDNTPPILSDLYKIMDEYIDNTKSNDEQKAGSAFLRKLKPFVHGSYSSFFDGQTTIDMANPVTCYSIYNTPDKIKPAVMHLILEQQFNFMATNDVGFRTLYIDEGWSVIRSNSEAIMNIVKTCRGLGLSLYIITQELSDIRESDSGDAILGNTATKIILGFENVFRKQIQGAFGLSNTEVEFLISAKVGEGILISNNIKTKIKIMLSALETELIIEKKTIGTKMSKDLDISKTVHLFGDLDNTQKDILVDQGFTHFKNGPKLGPGSGDYYIKNETKNESDKHFVLSYLLSEYAVSLGLTAEISSHGDLCDVELKDASTNILGIEVELGTNNAETLTDKTKRLNEAYMNYNCEGKRCSWVYACPAKLTRKYQDYNIDSFSFGEIKYRIDKFNELNI